MVPGYAIYAGTVGTYYSHASVLCSTGGSASWTNLTPGAGDQYYLIVPLSASEEGYFGNDSAGAPIPRGTGPCRILQAAATCP